MKNYLSVLSLLVFLGNSAIAGLENLPSLLKDDTMQVRRTKRKNDWQEALRSLKSQSVEQTDVIEPLSKFTKQYEELLQGRAFKMVLFFHSREKNSTPEYFYIVVKDENNYVRVEFVDGKQVLGEILE